MPDKSTYSTDELVPLIARTGSYPRQFSVRVPDTRGRARLSSSDGLENRQWHVGGGNRSEVAFFLSSRSTWLSLAVNGRRGGRRRTKANLSGRLRTTANAFEERAPDVRRRPWRSAVVRSRALRFQDRPPLSARGRCVGCHLGCQNQRWIGTYYPEQGRWLALSGRDRLGSGRQT